MLRLLLLSGALLFAPLALAADVEPPPVEKKIKAKKLEKLLVGSWRIYPVKDPELTKWLQGMASLDAPVAEIAAEYRLSPELAARIEEERAKSPPKLPPELQKMLRTGVTVTFDGKGGMNGSFGDEQMGGSYEVTATANNRLEVNTKPEKGREDVIVMFWIDADRMVWANQGKGGELAVARVAE